MIIPDSARIMLNSAKIILDSTKMCFNYVTKLKK